MATCCSHDNKPYCGSPHTTQHAMGSPAVFLDGKLIDTRDLVLYSDGGKTQTIYMYPFTSLPHIHDKHMVVKYGPRVIGITRDRHEEGPYDRFPGSPDDANAATQNATRTMLLELPSWIGEPPRAERLLMDLHEFTDEEDEDVEDAAYFYEHVNQNLLTMYGTSHYSVPGRGWLGLSICAHFKQT